MLDLEHEIEQMHARIEELELQALHAQVRLAEELEEVRRSFRAELVVPYRGGRAGARRRRALAVPNSSRSQEERCSRPFTIKSQEALPPRA